MKGFPGKTFEINFTGAYSRQFVKQMKDKKVNVVCRNFPDKPEQVRKKLKLSDGGVEFLFATRNLDERPILIAASRI